MNQTPGRSFYCGALKRSGLKDSPRLSFDGPPRPDGTNVAADIVIRPVPSEVALFEPEVLMDLSAYLDMDQIRRDYPPYLLRLTTVGDDGAWPADSGALAGGWLKLGVKSLIWYPVPEFEQAGYKIPRSWGELIRLSERLRSQGRIPWCFGTESGLESGWVATDWVEDLLLRTAGPDVYDRWVAHEIPFTHPAVRRAVELMGRIAFTPGYVAGGNEEITRTPFWAAQDPMFEEVPGCWLHRQASFAPGVWREGNLPGTDSAAFPFPAVDPDAPPSLLGAGDVFFVFTDRPEVRELVSFLLSPKFGQEWADRSEGGFMSPNLRFGLEHYGSEVTRLQAEVARSALEADTFRFDASDLMPPQVGSDAFFNGMTEYLSEGPDNLDDVLAKIEAQWPDS